MSKIFVKNYYSPLDVVETQKAIKLIKGSFETNLSRNLGLSRVSAPLFVEPETGLNDNLSGTEKAVSFNLLDGKKLEIVQSLAKWKRFALKKYSLSGLYTDMNAIRPNEVTDNLHSLYVDQWDWEKVITKEQRNVEFLKEIVRKIYEAFLETFDFVCETYPVFKNELPKEVTFVTSEELLKKYPGVTSKEREHAICKEHKAVFIMNIGNKLSDGTIHDARASDYDDWALNGDLMLYYPLLDIAFEVSSMGIRVNKDSLVSQLSEKNELFKLEMPYHKSIIADELPLTIGGGIGQSRLCMYMLNKAHIGEVQSSFWSESDIEEFKKSNIILL
ncbi:MAG: aspartate--ammonia ligase [Bacilli bacterium]|nr:aspartate--ammonia ligase [Bacilli bacterium]